ncbi:tetratricopeptide repeat protein [Psychrobacter sp. I-STPA6b]|uniref:tetratricopeptide repeat protein n=1 Tax=Psychrobacter sp. I-STPA6b TaxID=2585718 RepID=UPI001D0C791F|nr:hypothetical protein [Psychrobacter sp. I-STPA6b]
MTVPSFLHTSLISQLIKRSLYISCLGAFAIATTAQADTNASSPYIDLYQNQVNTNQANTNTASTVAAPSARIRSTQRITPVRTSNRPVATTSTAQAQAAQPQEPKTHVIRPVYNKAGAQGIDLLSGQLPQIPTPKLSVSDITYVPTIKIPQTQYGSEQLDVSLIDDFIAEISPHARHYPPNFNNVSQRYYSKLKLKELEEWLRPYADAPNASYDVLLRAAKLNGMGRNLDLGSDFTIRASTYVSRALTQQPDSAEANFLYGMMLSEGGGFNESKKYLNKAAAQGYIEAEQSLAQADLLSDRRGDALARLKRLQQQQPNNRQIQQQIALVENGKYYIWDLSQDN